ncbi:hypothetical protein G9A89_020763 [Geosiphon pyriformis]|nr:hypothetical protein G9A89_020763 [Geosiphon pyriformis]
MAVIKKSVKGFSEDTVSKNIAFRKKRKGGVLKDSVVHGMVLPDQPVGGSWGFEAGDTTKSDSVDMEGEFLIEETSINYEERNVLIGMDSNQMPKDPRLVTKQALNKPLGKINFLGNDDDDDIFLNKPVVLPLLLKKLVNMSARKSFALDIDLINISGKFAQDKLVVVRKLFSKINSFGRASTLSKFSGIIWVIFTSESSLMKATKLAANVKILVNTNLKKLTGHSDRAVVLKEILVETSAEAVCTALSEFGTIKSIKMQLIGLSDMDKLTWDMRDYYRVLLYTLPVGTNAHNVWNFIGSVGGKTCVIDCYLVTYAQARCAIVCFKLAKSLDAVMETTPVLKGAHLYWFYLGSAMCAKCEKLDHTSLGCVSGGKSSSSGLPHQVLSDADKGKLAAIYAKHSAPVAHSVSFGGVSWAKIVGESSFPPPPIHNDLVNAGFSLEIKPTHPVISDLDIRFAVLESSIANLVGQIGELAKRLDSFVLAVSQSSSGCQLSVTSPSQDQVGNIVIREGLGGATSGNTAAISVFSVSPEIKRLENMLEGLSASVLSLTARFDDSILASGALLKHFFK